MYEQLTAYIKKLIPLNDISKEQNLKELFKHIIIGKLAPSKILCRSADCEQFTYYLLDGEITLTDSAGVTTHLSSHDPRCRFPIAYEQKGAFTVNTISEISYLKISAETLDSLLTWDQVTTPLLRKPAQRDDENEVNWMSRILELELFHRIPPVNIQAMFLRFETVAKEQDELIIRQGDLGENYYVIKSGRCAIYRSDDIENNPLQYKLAELGPGDSFGEEALVSDTPRNATVVMREAGELAMLSNKDFLELLKEPVMQSVTYTEAEQLIENGARYIDARTAKEFEHIHLPNSINLPLDSIRERLAELDKSLQYVVYCDTGSRSAAACYILNQRGFIAKLLKNGLKSAPSSIALKTI